MASATGLVIIKDFTYRDVAGEEWSNKYWLTGTPPTTSAAWRVLADLLIDIERHCFGTSSRVVRAYGYNDNAEHAPSVWSHDYLINGETVPGTLSAGTDHLMAGDQAGVAWWQTDRRNTKGKWIYLRKYFHDGYVMLLDRDKISTPTLNAYQTFVTHLSDGTFDGGRKIRSQKQDEGLLNNNGDIWVTTRTLKRRGKRP